MLQIEMCSQLSMKPSSEQAIAADELVDIIRSYLKVGDKRCGRWRPASAGSAWTKENQDNPEPPEAVLNPPG
jgi:hypothetical protein